MLLNCQKCLLLASYFTAVNSLDTIPSNTPKFSKTYRTADKNTNFELRIEATIQDLIDNDGQKTFGIIDSFSYCLGSTDVTITSFSPDTVAVTGSKLIEIRDALAREQPGMFASVFGYFSSGKRTGKGHSTTSTGDKIKTLKEYKKHLTFSPFEENLIGIKSDTTFTISISRRRIKFKNLLILFASVLLFVNAGKVSKQATVWYFGGVSISVTIGALLLLYLIVNKVLPKRDSIILVGILSSFTAWLEYFFTGFIRQTVLSLAHTHWAYVVGYFVIFGLAGFVYCYIKGPPVNNPRVATVLQVFIQFCSCLGIYFSFNLIEIGLASIGIVVVSHIFYGQFVGSEIKIVGSKSRRSDTLWAEMASKNSANSKEEREELLSKRSSSISPSFLQRSARSIFNKKPHNDTTTSKLSKSADRIRDIQDENDEIPDKYVGTPTIIIKKPPRRSFLSKILGQDKNKSSTPIAYKRYLNEDEYQRQGYENTRIELNKLRKFCNSPKANPWDTVGKIEDPKRFSSFVKGNAHISEAELTNYEIELDKSEMELEKEKEREQQEQSSFHVEDYSEHELDLLDPKKFSKWENGDDGEKNLEKEAEKVSEKQSTSKIKTSSKTLSYPKAGRKSLPPQKSSHIPVIKSGRRSMAVLPRNSMKAPDVLG